MFDPRIYRAAFLPAIAAFIAMMFSLQAVPPPLQGPISTPTFEGGKAARAAREIVAAAPLRTPGSADDRRVAEMVRERFGSIEGAMTAVQRVDSSFQGNDVSSDNVVLTLPGQSEEVLLVVAARDSAEGVGATTSAAATATLLELAEDLGGTRHQRTIVLASVSDTGEGSDSTSELIDRLPAPDGITAAIAIERPGARGQLAPFVIPGRSGPHSTSAQLIDSAASIASTQFGEKALGENAWRSFSHLAVPFGSGLATALDAQGVESVSISAAGLRDPTAEQDVVEKISGATLGRAGSTVLDLLLTLDTTERKPRSGPESYVRLGDNLLPGWTLSILAIAIILPSLLAAADLAVRDRRRDPRTARRALPWTLERILVPFGGLMAVYGMALVGLLPDPSFPFDPGDYPAGTRAAVAFTVIALVIALLWLLIRPLRTPLDSEPQGLAANGGVLCALSVIGIWLFNPFMALLLAPVTHLWLLPARESSTPRRIVVAAVGLVALIPFAATLIEAGGALELGLSAPWQVLLLIVNGHFSPLLAALWCGLFGGLLACVAAGGARPMIETLESKVNVLGPRGYAGPGSLGGASSQPSGPVGRSGP